VAAVEKTPARRAPPTRYSPEVGAAICEAIATTPRGLDYLCAARAGFPNPRTVTEWLGAHPEFRKAYEIAKDRQADLLFFECLEIADDAKRDTKIVMRGDEPVEVMDFEWVARSKLRVETRLKMAGKLAPKKYGEKLDLTGTLGFTRHEDALEQLR
jgi:hypothetical protein